MLQRHREEGVIPSEALSFSSSAMRSFCVCVGSSGCWIAILCSSSDLMLSFDLEEVDGGELNGNPSVCEDGCGIGEKCSDCMSSMEDMLCTDAEDRARRAAFFCTLVFGVVEALLTFSLSAIRFEVGVFFVFLGVALDFEPFAEVEVVFFVLGVVVMVDVAEDAEDGC